MAFAVIPDGGRRRRFEKTCRHLLPHPNTLAYTACLAAYRDGEPWRQALLDVLRRNAAIVHDFVRDELPGLHMDPVEATYLAWIDARALGEKDPASRMQLHGVAPSPGHAFGAPGFLRLNFATPLPLLHEGLRRLVAAVDEMRSSKSRSE
jgi:cystathionine beta-lyase